MVHQNILKSGRTLGTIVFEKQNGLESFGDIRLNVQNGLLRILLRDLATGQEFVIGSNRDKLNAQKLIDSGELNLCLVDASGNTVQAKNLKFQ